MTRLQERRSALSRDLSKFVSKLSEGVSEKGVHRLRTTIRRIETFVHRAGSKAGKKQQKTLHELRSLRKRAGKVRDLDIQIYLLNSVGNGSAFPDRRVLAQALQKKRARQATRLVEATQDLEGSKLLKRVARMTAKSLPAPAKDSSAILNAVRAKLAQLAADYSGQALKRRRLHELRISLKLLRYQSELAGETPERKNLAEELKSIHDSIGQWHDWEMLAESAEKFFADRLNCALLVEIRALLAARYSAASSAATNFLAAYGHASLKKQSSSLPPLSAFAQGA